MKNRCREAAEMPKKFLKKSISKQEIKDLKVLADDFCLLNREDVQKIIETCKSYAEGQQKIMRVYTAVYMHQLRNEQKWGKKYGY